MAKGKQNVKNLKGTSKGQMKISSFFIKGAATNNMTMTATTRPPAKRNENHLPLVPKTLISELIVIDLGDTSEDCDRDAEIPRMKPTIQKRKISEPSTSRDNIENETSTITDLSNSDSDFVDTTPVKEVVQKKKLRKRTSSPRVSLPKTKASPLKTSSVKNAPEERTPKRGTKSRKRNMPLPSPEDIIASVSVLLNMESPFKIVTPPDKLSENIMADNNTSLKNKTIAQNLFKEDIDNKTPDSCVDFTKISSSKTMSCIGIAPLVDGLSLKTSQTVDSNSPRPNCVQKLVSPKCSPKKNNINFNELGGAVTIPEPNHDSSNIDISDVLHPLNNELPLSLNPRTVNLASDNSSSSKIDVLTSDNSVVQPGSSNSVEGIFNDLFLDEWDFDKMLTEEEQTLSLEKLHRCRVQKVMQVAGKREQILSLQSTVDKSMTTCLLKGMWANYSLSVGDVISIEASQSSCADSRWYIDSSVGLLVLNPDKLMSSTTVVGSLFCSRRSVLSNYYTGMDSESRVMVIGIVVHDLMQKVLQYKLYQYESIVELANDLLKAPNMIRMLYSSGLSLVDTRKEIMEFVPQIVMFVKRYMKNTPNATKAGLPPTNWQGEITEIRDIEENVWTPELGLKGKIDVTAEVRLHGRGRKVVPIEIKTGKPSRSAEHKGQVMLYQMMMGQTSTQIDSGLLLYIRSGIMEEVKVNHCEKAGLVHLRNQLTTYLARAGAAPVEDVALAPLSLPEPISHHSACGKCPYLPVCSTFLKRDGGNKVTANNPLKILMVAATAHLTDVHIDYFIHWSSLVLLEDTDKTATNQELADLWTLTPKQREARGSCLRDVTIVNSSVDPNGRHLYNLCRPNAVQTSLDVGDYVALSSSDRVALYTGTIVDMTEASVSITVDRKVRPDHATFKFHVDSISNFSTSTYNLTFLSCLLEDSDRAASLRRTVIDKMPPTFSKLPGSVLTCGREVLAQMNVGQQRAVLKALSANEYLLIKGMPGTGKTTTIAGLIAVLVALGRSVLVVSHTHSAVDNLLLKIKERGVDLLRLGANSRIHPDLRALSETALVADCQTPEQLEEKYMAKMVVGCTCLGSNHAFIRRRQFHVCIVDESTQVLQSSVLRSIYAAEKFILVGDPDQLAPVVKSKRAKLLGLSESLFSRLDCKSATVSLGLQYRMNKTITLLANGLTYEGQLECGSEQIANATTNVRLEVSAPSWLKLALSSRLEQAVVFLDTGRTNQNAANEKSSYDNTREAAVIMQLLGMLIQGGVPGANVGVITPYRAQVSLLTRLVAALADGTVEVNTVDQYQGRDKEVILYSCSRSDQPDRQYKDQASEILGDKRRLTVAITRAKHKLIIVGDCATLRNYEPFEQLLECLNETQIVPLRDGCDGFHWATLLADMEKTALSASASMDGSGPTLS